MYNSDDRQHNLLFAEQNLGVPSCPFFSCLHSAHFSLSAFSSLLFPSFLLFLPSFPLCIHSQPLVEFVPRCWSLFWAHTLHHILSRPGRKEGTGRNPLWNLQPAHPSTVLAGLPETGLSSFPSLTIPLSPCSCPSSKLPGNLQAL